MFLLFVPATSPALLITPKNLSTDVLMQSLVKQIGRIASADVVMHLIKFKCIPILLYAACPVNCSLEKSLQFFVTRILMKTFKTRSSDIVMECQNYFGFYTISTLIRKRKATFLYKLVNSQNELCELFSLVAQEEISIISRT